LKGSDLPGPFCFIIQVKDQMETIIVKDSNGNQLNDGDSVILIKSLKVKGGGTTLKTRNADKEDPLN
jgi:uncharacterized Zn ribbon protein